MTTEIKSKLERIESLLKSTVTFYRRIDELENELIQYANTVATPEERTEILHALGIIEL